MSHFLTPALALIIWTLIMMLVMYKRRIPAMNAISKRKPDYILRAYVHDIPNG